MLELKNVSKFYYNKGIITTGFTKVNLDMKKGEFIGAFPSYVYIKDQKDKHKLIIDESVANIIRNIFDWNVNEGRGKI